MSSSKFSNQAVSGGQSSGQGGAGQGGGALIQDDDTISLLDLLDNFLYHKWYFIIATVLATVLAVTYAIVATPIYTADALVQVEEKKGASLLGALDQVTGPLLGAASPVIGEIEIIRSRAVIGEAVDNLKSNVIVEVGNRVPLFGDWLARTLETDESGLVIPPTDMLSFAWGGEKLVINDIRVPRDLYGEKLELRIGENRNWELILEDTGETLAKGQASGEPIVSEDGQFAFELGAFRAHPGTVFDIRVLSRQSEMERVLKNLTVSESGRQSNMIRLTYMDPEPAVAAQMLNAIAQAYLQQNLDRRSAEAEKTLQFLKGELPRLRLQLDASEQELNEFRTKTRTVDLTLELEELLKLSTEVETQQMQSELKRRELAIRYDPSHPTMRALEAKMAGLRSDEQVIAKRISALPAVQQDYIRLARNVEVNNHLYVGLLNNTQQLEVAKAGTIGNVAIIDSAIAPEKPTKPKKVLVVAIGGFVGMFLGFLLTQVVAFMTKVVRDPKKLEQEVNLPILAIMPLDASQITHSVDQEEESFMLVHHDPDGAGAEALRSLRTALLFALSEKMRSKVILITSAVPSEGKSFISANLAYMLGASSGKKVLLIDADIRRSSMHRYLTFDQKAPGLSNVLQGGEIVENAIVKNALSDLDFLPAGVRARNPGDLLGSESMQTLINEMAEQYDYVVIDSPPLLPVHDARALGTAADVSLFVARQDAVSLSEVNDAIDLFHKAGNRFDGMVFNGFVPSRIRYGYGYGYGNYSRKYGYGVYGHKPEG